MITSEILWQPNGGRLVVAMPETGTLIRRERATDTFVEVIRKIGIERVEGLDITIRGTLLVSGINYPNITQRQVDEYYIVTYLSPEEMRSNLNQIAEQLGISLYAELFP